MYVLRHHHSIKLMFPNADTYTTDRPIYTSAWKKYLKTAWRVSPRLAIMMGVRFNMPKGCTTCPCARYISVSPFFPPPSMAAVLSSCAPPSLLACPSSIGCQFLSDAVRSVLERVVKERVSEAVCAPEAIQFLVTPRNVEANIPELRYLLYWGEVRSPPFSFFLFLCSLLFFVHISFLFRPQVSPPTALSLLQKEYKSHPYVTQYAVRVLQSFTPDTIIFYLPQLVQALRYVACVCACVCVYAPVHGDMAVLQWFTHGCRHDNSGLVEEYLIEAAAK